MTRPKQILCIHPRAAELDLQTLLGSEDGGVELAETATVEGLDALLGRPGGWDLILGDWSCYLDFGVRERLASHQGVLDASVVLLKPPDCPLSPAEAFRHGAADVVIQEDAEHLRMVCRRELRNGAMRAELRALKGQGALSEAVGQHDTFNSVGVADAPPPATPPPAVAISASGQAPLDSPARLADAPAGAATVGGSLAQERINALIGNGGLTLEFQPIISFRTTDEHSSMFEALVRLRDESGSLLPPAAFLPVLAQEGVLGKVDLWIFRRALAILEEMQRNGSSETVLFINLDTRTLLAPDLVKAIGAFVIAARIMPGSVVVEVRRQAFIEAREPLLRLTGALRTRKHGLLLEDPDLNDLDFLDRFTDILTHVKLDRSITQGLVGRQVAQSSLERYVARAHALGMRVIALAVDNAELLPLLFKVGVDAIQGHFVSMPYQNLMYPDMPRPDAGERAPSWQQVLAS